ncbi:MAG: DUF2269 family protein [Acidimicrobiales bacterium]|jgi:hypothetical protein
MVSRSPLLVAVSSNRGAAYDLVLLAHVLSALVGFGAVAVAGVFALVLARRGPATVSVRRYYRPGVNWAGRVLFVVPVLGTALVVMSRGGWSFSDSWVAVGLVLWAAAAMAGEMALWPTERGLQQLVASGTFDPSEHRRLCLQVVGVATVLTAVFVVATVVMVSKP